MTSKFTLSIALDNSAFRTEDGSIDWPSVADTLRRIARRVDDSCDSGAIIDGNGNRVGSFDTLDGEDSPAS